MNMNKKRIRIIRTAVGSMPSWGLIEELKRNEFEVIGTDCNPLSFGHFLLEKSYVTPKGNESNFIDKILEIALDEKIDAIITGPEEEIIALSKNKDMFENEGILVLCPENKTVNICSDKYETYKFFKENSIPTPKHFEHFSNVQFPCIIKPRFGRGGIGIYKCEKREELEFYIDKVKDPVIQQFIEGEEYTIDLLADKEGNPLSIVPRMRIDTESGVSVKAKTVYDEEMLYYCKFICKKLKLFGPSCIQCIKSSEGIKFIEINTRFGGGSVLSTKADPLIIQNLKNLILNKECVKSNGFKRNIIMLRYYSEVFVDEHDLKKIHD
ncbi:MAG: hypothetical protein CI953_361 [Methanohalophilus sp.]|nr:MAG: hypothetical protein CI953_361 [Methanohalophilus sp.]